MTNYPRLTAKSRAHYQANNPRVGIVVEDPYSCEQFVYTEDGWVPAHNAACLAYIVWQREVLWGFAKIGGALARDSWKDRGR